jgi:hypothetical protein
LRHLQEPHASRLAFQLSRPWLYQWIERVWLSCSTS